MVWCFIRRGWCIHWKVDADASVVDNVPACGASPGKIMLCEEPPANGCNFAVGEVIHIAYLGDLSVYHVRLKRRADD